MAIDLFVSTFLAVFLLGFQQQNVVGGHYRAAAVTSFGIAAAQFVMIKAVGTGGWYEFIPMGVGGSLGITISMAAHRRVMKKKEE